MAWLADGLQVAIVVRPILGQRDDVVDLVALLDPALPLAWLAQVVVAL